MTIIRICLHHRLKNNSCLLACSMDGWMEIGVSMNRNYEHAIISMRYYILYCLSANSKNVSIPI